MEENRIKELENIVFNFFKNKGIDTEKKHTQNRILGYVWYVLHYTFDLSTNKIVREYGVTRCWVFRIISRTKYRISNCKVEIQEFAELTEYLQNKNLYPVYD